MALPTLSSLPIASPLAKVLSDQTSEVQAREKVGIAAFTDWNLLDVRGMVSDAAIENVMGVSSMAIGNVRTAPDGVLVRLRRDQFMLLTADLRTTIAHLESKPAESLLTLTDITHGRSVICLCGARTADVLPKLCGLNFADTTFPDQHAAQTSLAKVRTLIMRLDAGSLPAYYLIVDRSLAAYVWDVVYDAAQEWDAVILSQDSLKRLRM